MQTFTGKILLIPVFVFRDFNKLSKQYVFIILLMLLSNEAATGQSWQWALTQSLAPRSQAVAVKQDAAQCVYIATYTDSVSTPVESRVEKRDVNKQLLWQKQIIGHVVITDLELNVTGNAVVIGYFMGNISIDGIILTSITTFDYSAFIFETDANGVVQWAHEFNPVNGNFQTGDLYIDINGTMYLTSQVSGNFGFCAFHQLNAQGFIIRNEFNNNFENRTFTRVLTDADGNVYLSGTCGNGAMFDALSANPSFSYQNFLVKYDSSLNAQWLITRNYITFDDNNSLSTDGRSLYWAFDDFNGLSDTTKILKCNYQGQVLNEIISPLAGAFFPSSNYATDKHGNGILAVNVYVSIYLFRYDSAFNILWQDTLRVQTSGFTFGNGLTCYDSCFYLSAAYLSDSLVFDHIVLHNPNVNANYQSDVFIAKWSNQLPVSVNILEEGDNRLIVFPNPASNKLNVQYTAFKTGDQLVILDVLGNIAYAEQIESMRFEVATSQLKNGIYFLKVSDRQGNQKGNCKVVVMR